MSAKHCQFCELSQSRIIAANEWAVGIRDAYPVTEGHSLVIPRRHIADFFSLTAEEALACNTLLSELRTTILAADKSVSGFNIGVNAGADAGQTIFHCHVHLIPRRHGDVENPRGGIRHVIPGKGSY